MNNEMNRAFRCVVLSSLLLFAGCAYRGTWSGQIVPDTYYDRNDVEYHVAALRIESGPKVEGALGLNIKVGLPATLLDSSGKAIPISEIRPGTRVSVFGEYTMDNVLSPDGKQMLAASGSDARTEDPFASSVIKMRGKPKIIEVPSDGPVDEKR